MVLAEWQDTHLTCWLNPQHPNAHHITLKHAFRQSVCSDIGSLILWLIHSAWDRKVVIDWSLAWKCHCSVKVVLITESNLKHRAVNSYEKHMRNDSKHKWHSLFPLRFCSYSKLFPQKITKGPNCFSTQRNNFL